MDCDAFYASVEKRDNPEIRDQPVIIGGGKRGVVSTACYIARINGVHSAMPMFKALKLCPDAVVVPPRMDAYVEVSKQIKSMMLQSQHNFMTTSLAYQISMIRSLGSVAYRCLVVNANDYQLQELL